MTYEEMKKAYPNKEIKLVPAEYEKQYASWGFKTIDTCTEPAWGRMFDYCFMVEV